MSTQSQEVAQRTPQQLLATGIRSEQFRSQIEMVLPPNVTVDRFTRSLLTAIATQPDLASADRDSVVLAAIRCAQDGLLPDGKQAAIAVFGGKATYMPMIGGLRVALADFGWTLVTRAVYEGDEFEFTEQPPEIKHKPTSPGARGGLAYAYAIATHRDGRRLQRVVFPDEVEARRKVAKTQNIWKTWPAEMWEKTAGRILFDEIPLSEIDEQRSRLASIVASWEGDPSKAVTAIYGPERETRAIEAATVPPGEPGEVDAGARTSAASDAGEQAGGGENPPAVAGSSPEPEPEPEFNQPADGEEPGIEFGEPQVSDATAEPALRVPDVVVDQAAQTIISSHGVTIVQLLEMDGADQWISWALRGNLEAGPELEALELVIRERRPDLWADRSEAS